MGSIPGWHMGFIFWDVGKLVATAVGDKTFSPSVYKPYSVHQSSLAVIREGCEESQGPTKSPLRATSYLIKSKAKLRRWHHLWERMFQCQGFFRGLLLGVASSEGQLHFQCSWEGFSLPSFIRMCEVFFQPTASTLHYEILSIVSSLPLPSSLEWQIWMAFYRHLLLEVNKYGPTMSLMTIEGTTDIHSVLLLLHPSLG